MTDTPEITEVGPGDLTPSSSKRDEFADAFASGPENNNQSNKVLDDLANEELKHKTQLRIQKNIVFYTVLITSFLMLLVFYTLLTGHKCWYVSCVDPLFSGNATCNATDVYTDRLLSVIRVSNFSIVLFSLAGVIPAALIIATLKGVFNHSEAGVGKEDLEWVKIASSLLKVVSNKPH